MDFFLLFCFVTPLLCNFNEKGVCSLAKRQRGAGRGSGAQFFFFSIIILGLIPLLLYLAGAFFVSASFQETNHHLCPVQRRSTQIHAYLRPRSFSTQWFRVPPLPWLPSPLLAGLKAGELHGNLTQAQRLEVCVACACLWHTHAHTHIHTRLWRYSGREKSISWLPPI